MIVEEGMGERVADMLTLPLFLPLVVEEDAFSAIHCENLAIFPLCLGDLLLTGFFCLGEVLRLGKGDLLLPTGFFCLGEAVRLGIGDLLLPTGFFCLAGDLLLGDNMLIDEAACRFCIFA